MLSHLQQNKAKNLMTDWRAAVVVVAAMALMVMSSPAGNSQTISPPSGAAKLYVDGQLIIKYAAGTGERDKGGIRGVLNAVTRTELPSIGAELVELTGMSVEEALAKIRGDARIEYAEPNYYQYAIATPNDPDFSRLWGMNNTGQTGGTVDADIDAPEAWDVSTGDTVIVGVIDTGVDTAHVDLHANLWTNPGEIPNNGIDDDGNGYIDDMHGWDFVNNDNGPVDDHGHGTHTSGTVAAVGNNSIGVAGVCWKARIMALKFLDAGGYGNTSNAVLAVAYATKMKARLTSNSWGGGGYSQALKDAIDSAGAHGILFVAAAGNNSSDNDAYPNYPCGYNSDNIIVVAATDHNDQMASFSNWGATTVDLAAPGVSVYSSLPGDSYGYYSGTSMACPHVSGAAALVWSKYPNLTYLQVKGRIVDMADKLPNLAGKCVSGGRLNVFMSIAEPDSTPPSPISDLSISTIGGSKVTLSWTATGDDSTLGRASSYDIRYSRSPIDNSNFDAATTVADEPSPQSAGMTDTYTVQGLDFSTTYYFGIKVLDEWKNSSGVSNSPSALTLGPPIIQTAPDSLTADLFTGDTVRQMLTINNGGVSELDFEISASALAELARYPGSDTIVEMTNGFRSSARPFDFGHLPVREPIASDSFQWSEKRGGGINILLITAASSPSEIQNLLRTYPNVARVDVFDAYNGTPTLTYLQQYHSIILMGSYDYGDPVRLGDVLADYVDWGGGIVVTVPAFATGWAIDGRFLTDGYMPFTVGPGPIDGADLGTFNAAHPIMRNVHAVHGELLVSTTLVEGAVDVARWNTGNPFVATKGATVAGVNIFVASSGYWTGDVPTLLYNAVLWSTGGQWLIARVDSGTVPAGASVEVPLVFDAEDMFGGNYFASVIVNSNDPVTPTAVVPARLHVTGAPQIATKPDTVEFGVVYIGYPRSQTLTVLNEGTDTLIVTNIAPSSPDYSVDSTAFKVNPKEEFAVRVSFAPAVVGEAWGTLTIASNDPSDPSIMVTLHGEGRICPVLWTDPHRLSDSLLTGDASAKTLVLGNSGGSPLNFTIDLDNFDGPNDPPPPAPVADLAAVQALMSQSPSKVEGFDPNAKSTEGLYAETPGSHLRLSGNPGEILASFHAPSQIGQTWGVGFDGADVWLSDYYNIADFEVSISGTLKSSFSCRPWAGVWAADMAWDGRYLWQVNVGGDNGIYQLDPSNGNVVNSIHDPDHIWDYTSERGLAYDKKRDVFYVGGWNQDMVYKIKGLSWDHPGEIISSFVFWGVSGLAWHPAGTLWIAVNGDNYIFQVDPETGSIISYIRPPASSYWSGAGLAIDRHGNLWYDDQNNNMVYLINSGVPASNWLSVAPESGTIAAGGTLSLQVEFNALGMTGGAYTGDIIIGSNDCRNPVLTVQAHLQVTDAPDISVEPDSLRFSDTFVGNTDTLPLVIANVGTAPLAVSGIFTDNPEFTLSATGMVVGPGAANSVSVFFRPTRPGASIGQLTINSNDPDEPSLIVNLRGAGVLPPEIAIDVTGLSDTLYTGGTSAQRFTISNTGDGPLEVRIRMEAIEGLRDAIKRCSQGITVSGTQVIDGKSVTTFTVAELELFKEHCRTYRQELASLREVQSLPRIAIVGGDTYNLFYRLISDSSLTDHYLLDPVEYYDTDPQVAGYDGLVVSEFDGDIVSTEMQTLSNFAYSDKPIFMGMDDISIEAPAIRDQLHSLFGIASSDHGDYFWGSLNPANPISEGLTEVYSYDDGDNDWFSLTDADWIFAGSDGRYYGASTRHEARNVLIGEYLSQVDYAGNRKLLANAINWMMGSREWLRVEPRSATIRSGLSQVFDVTFSAKRLAGGDYTANVVIDNNDPDESMLILPAALHVVSAPVIVVKPDSLDFDTVYVGFPDTLLLQLANEGSDMLNVSTEISGTTGFSVSPSSVSIPPVGTFNLSIIFDPSGPGIVEGILKLSSNDPYQPNVEVSLSGLAQLPPRIVVSPDSLTAVVDEGDSAYGVMTVANNGPGELRWQITGAAAQNVRSFALPALRVNLSEDSTFHDPIGGQNPGTRPAMLEFSQLTASLADLTGKKIGLTGYFSYWALNGDLLARGAEIRYVWFPINEAQLDSIDVLVLDDGIYWASSGDIVAIRNWLARGKSLFVNARYSWHDVNPVLPGTGISRQLSPWCQSGYLTDIRPHVITTGVDSLYYDYRCNYLQVNAPAQAIVFDTGAVADIAISRWGSGSIIVCADNPATDWNIYNGDNRLFVNQVIDWLAVGNFVSVSPTAGTLLPTEEQELSVKYNAARLYGGDYVATVDIRSNDPASTLKQVPVSLHVVSVPNIALPRDTVDFDSAYIGFGKTDSLEVRNAGTAALELTSIALDNAVFSVTPTNVVIPPLGSRQLRITFLPVTTGEVIGTLTITSNDADQPTVTATIMGNGVHPPHITTTPDSLSAILTEGDSTTETLTIGNSGLGDLLWEIPGFGNRDTRQYLLPAVTVDDTSQSRSKNGDPVKAHFDIPALEAPFKDLTGLRIGFANGYAKYTITSDLRARGATVSYVDFPISQATLDSLDILDIGYQIGYAENDIANMRQWLQRGHAIFFETDDSYSFYNANELMLGSGIQSIADYYSCYTGNMTDIEPHPITAGVDTVWEELYCAYLRITAPAHAVVYDSLSRAHAAVSFLGAGKIVSVANDVSLDWQMIYGDTRKFCNQIFDWLAGGSSITVDPSAGRVVPGQTQDVTVAFNAKELAAGYYYVNIGVNSNDPAQSLKEIPTELYVTGTPKIAVVPDSMAIDSAYIGFSKTDTLEVRNLGSVPLLVSSIVSDNPNFTVTPATLVVPRFSRQKVAVTLSATAPGAVSGMLTLTSNDSVHAIVTVKLTGTGVYPPNITVSAESLFVIVPEGESTATTMTIGNTGLGDLVWEIPGFPGNSATTITLGSRLIDTAYARRVARGETTTPPTGDGATQVSMNPVTASLG